MNCNTTTSAMLYRTWNVAKMFTIRKTRSSNDALFILDESISFPPNWIIKYFGRSSDIPSSQQLTWCLLQIFPPLILRKCTSGLASPPKLKTLLLLPFCRRNRSNQCMWDVPNISIHIFHHIIEELINHRCLYTHYAVIQSQSVVQYTNSFVYKTWKQRRSKYQTVVNIPTVSAIAGSVVTFLD
jgi:hypothetical protein